MLPADIPDKVLSLPRGHSPATCGCRACSKWRRTQGMASESQPREPEADDGPAGTASQAEVKTGEALDADLPVLRTKPTSRTIRPLIAHWIALRSLDPSITVGQAAEKLGVTKSTLQTYIYRATKYGWLKFDDPMSRVEYEIIPKVLDNLNHFLDAKDKMVTVEAAKGTLFKTYAESKGAGQQQQTVLALKIEMPDGTETKIMGGHIVGKPKRLEDE